MTKTRFHVLASVPRSGSTLFANILRQNPAFYVSDTSPLAPMITAAQATLAQRPEFLSLLGNYQDKAEKLVTHSLQGLLWAWLDGVREEGIAPPSARVLVDKDRSAVWLFRTALLHELVPDAKVICLVRDPREVVASVLRNQAKQHLVVEGTVSLSAQVGQVISPQHVVGASIRGVEDVLLRSRVEGASDDGVYIVQYEQFVADPTGVIEKVYAALEEPYFEHDLLDVKNSSRDIDFLYKNLWPHEGSGPVTPRRPTWPQVLPPAVAAHVLQTFPLYCQAFGYR